MNQPFVAPEKMILTLQAITQCSLYFVKFINFLFFTVYFFLEISNLDLIIFKKSFMRTVLDKLLFLLNIPFSPQIPTVLKSLTYFTIKEVVFYCINKGTAVAFWTIYYIPLK